MLVIDLPERVYCADVVYPMAMISCADKKLMCLTLDNQPKEYNKKIESPLKYQVTLLK